MYILTHSDLPGNSLSDVAFAPSGKICLVSFDTGILLLEAGIWTVSKSTTTGTNGAYSVQSLVFTPQYGLWAVGC